MSTKRTKSGKGTKKSFPITNQLKALRRLHDMSLETVAKKVKIKYDSARNWEEGKTCPKLPVLLKMCEIFGVTLDYLLLWDETPYPFNLNLFLLGLKIEGKGKKVMEHTITNIEALLEDSDDKKIEVKLDDFDCELTGDIRENIKSIRKTRRIETGELADLIEVERYGIYRYENEASPPMDKLVKIADCLNASCHVIATGQRLQFDFKNQKFLDLLLKCDRLMPGQDREFIIKIMRKMSAP